MHRLGICALAVILGLPGVALAQVSLADLGWMQGAWRGQVGSGETPQFLEETWSASAAGTMTAMVRMRTAENTIFVELISIAESADGVYLHIQQFKPDMSPLFSPAQRMKLTELQGQQVTFVADTPGGLKSLTYRRDGSAFTINVGLTEGNTFVANLNAVGDVH